MSEYLREKLDAIKEHVKNLVDRKPALPFALDQDYVWIIGALSGIESEVTSLEDTLEAFGRIKEAVENGGEPAFVIKRVERILDEWQRRVGR